MAHKKNTDLSVPKPRQLASGTWFVQLRLCGESISVSANSEKECIVQARYIKSEYQAGKRAKKEEKKQITLKQACQNFVEARKNALSPSTIRGYNYIIKNRFQSLMERNVSDISESDWIIAVNKEAAVCSPKTIKNTWGFIASVIRKEFKMVPPNVTLPQIPKNERPFLSAEQIKIFVDAIKGTDVEIAALLGLSSMRRSEICALRWENVDLKNRLIHVKGAAVYDESDVLVHKQTTKNASSTRTIPIMMDELYNALDAAKQPSGLVVTCAPNVIRNRINRICELNGLPKVGTHGLRHSFASLAKHLGMPEQLTMQIGGWSDYQTMRKIYTHISQKDANSYKNAMSEFYNKKEDNANNNAN